MRSTSILIGLAVTLFLASCTPERQAADLIIRDVTVYDGEGGVPFVATVAVKHGKFVAIDRQGGTYRTDQIVNGEGLYMTPGLWDMHAHTANEEKDNVDVSAFPKYGVTTIRDTGGFTNIVLERKAAIASGAIAGPAIYFVGPTLNGEAFATFQRAVTTEAEVREATDEAAKSGASMIKIHRAFKPELLPVVIDAAHQHGLKITGHIPLGVSPLDACEAGMDGIEHIGSFLEAWISAAPKEKATTKDAFAYMLSDEAAPLYACLAKRGVNVTPTLVVYPAVARSRIGDKPMPPDYFAFMDGVEKIALRLYHSGVTLLTGTDTAAGGPMNIPPGSSMLDELELLQKSGLPPPAIINAATTNPARELGLENERGAIAVGEAADFLLLEADPGADVANFRKLKAVYQAGRKIEP